MNGPCISSDGISNMRPMGRHIEGRSLGLAIQPVENLRLLGVSRGER